MSRQPDPVARQINAIAKRAAADLCLDVRCPEHDRAPTVVISEMRHAGIAQGLHLDCCCDRLRRLVVARDAARKAARAR